MEKYKLFKCSYKTKDGWQIGYMIAKDKTDASLGLIIQGRIKHTDIHMEITEVDMNGRMFLGEIK
jgi:hypothetical protein